MSKLLSFFIFFFFLFLNANLLADVTGDIAQINALKETGSLSDRDYNSLLEKSIVKTKEYNTIKNLFDSKIINFEEFENFKNKITIKYTIEAKYDVAKEANYFENKLKHYE